MKKSGITITTLLGLLFVALKLTGQITWSWWWVTLPFWGGFAVLIAILVTTILVAIILKAID